MSFRLFCLLSNYIYICSCIFFLTSCPLFIIIHALIIWPFIHIYICAQAHTLSFTHSSLSIPWMLIWEILIFWPEFREWSISNAKVASKWGFFCILSLRQLRILAADVILHVGRCGTFFINVFSFHLILFWGSTWFDGCGSSCWIPGVIYYTN